MKAKLMFIGDSDNSKPILFGVKFIGLRRPIFLMEGKSFFETGDKDKCLEKVKEVNSYIKKNPELESQLRANKDIVGVKI
jgi:hypothetical protein